MNYESIKPKFKNNSVPIVITSSNEYSLILGVLIQSIISNSNNDNNYDIVILEERITDYNKRLLFSQITSRENFSLRFYDVSSFIATYKFHVGYHINPLTYARLLLIDLMGNYDKVIYLDCDVIVNYDIAELYKIDMEGYLVAAAVDTVIAGINNSVEQHPLRKQQYEYIVDVLGIDRVFEYFNAGVLLLNIRELSQSYNSSDLVSLALQKQWKWFDQDILNKICYTKVYLLEQSWNYMSHRLDSGEPLLESYAPEYIYDAYCKARVMPKIIHFCGRTIPCYVPTADNAHIFWQYARKTPFYELLLYRMSQSLKSSLSWWYSDNPILRYIKKIIKKIIPFGSKRYEVLKTFYFKYFNE